jgi:hypothetical protein
MQIDAVEQRSTQSPQVSGALRFATATIAHWVPQVTAGTRIDRRYEQRSRRKEGTSARTGYVHNPVFQWLTKGLESGTSKLREFIEKQHTMVRKTHLAWSWQISATNEPRFANGMMRRAKGPL